MADGMPPLIAREVLLGNPKRWQPTLSADGTRIAYLAPDERDALQIWVRTLGREDDRCVSAERRSIWNHEWAWDSETIVYRQDTDGDENYHTSAIELATGNASPLFSADKIRIPPLIGQGANDARVKQAESEQIVAAIEKNGGTATYVLYPDEGHGFIQAPNRMDFMARVEKFLAEHLGGRYEPMRGERIEGSSAIVREVRPGR